MISKNVFNRSEHKRHIKKLAAVTTLLGPLLTWQTFAECNDSLNDWRHVRHKLRPHIHWVWSSVSWGCQLLPVCLSIHHHNKHI